MLLGLITAISAVSAAAVCIGTHAFDSLAWLWVLPVSAAGSFLGQLILAVLFLILIGIPVDPDKPQQHDSPFYRRVIRVYAPLVMVLARVHIKTQGLEKTPEDGRFLLVCNHLSEADPVILLHFFAGSQLAFISKKENKNMFIVGKIMHRILCQLVDRENDRQSLKTVIRCIQLLRDDEASIAVFPEGYIRDDRKFHELRPGVFKIAQKAGVPIVVCTLHHTEKIFPNLRRYRPSHTELHLLEVIPAQALEGKTTVQIAEYVHGIMAADLGPGYLPAKPEESA